jgi:Cap4 SAVED domain
VNYALSRRRREAFQKALKDKTADVSIATDIVRAVRSVFIEFQKDYPGRASEVGEVLAYCIAVDHLKATSKMSLKTSGNMPVHGLDGIHALFEKHALTIYFLESKLAKTANDGAREYAESLSFSEERKALLA